MNNANTNQTLRKKCSWMESLECKESDNSKSKKNQILPMLQCKLNGQIFIDLVDGNDSERI